jgi:hypothetical protein
MEADRRRREYLGSNPQNASAQASTDSIMISQLSVRVIKAPSWWSDSLGGEQLSDGNVLEEVFTKAVAQEQARKEAVLKSAEEATKKLKQSK